jgi:aldose 1-epimerase
VDADTYLPTDEGLIPTGEIRSVEGTPFDFRTAKTMGKDMDADSIDLKYAGGFDHCLNFVGGATETPVKRASLYDPESGRVMDVYTDQPCVQIYAGNFLEPDGYPFKGGFVKKKQALMCLETQQMPDSVNHENFTNCVLKVGEVYDTVTEYRFSVK